MKFWMAFLAFVGMAALNICQLEQRSHLLKTNADLHMQKIVLLDLSAKSIVLNKQLIRRLKYCPRQRL